MTNNFIKMYIHKQIVVSHFRKPLEHPQERRKCSFQLSSDLSWPRVLCLNEWLEMISSNITLYKYA